VRPLKLCIKGFTAFRDEQEVDFTDLDLFAIVGPTGSGKSSVLDAMTYALFGRVDRVDEKSTRQMISQGQPRMAVTLDFQLGHDRYRVTRSLPRGGTTRVLVQRWDGEDWRQAGEGSDKVTGANRMLRELIGLDFDGFTRSVLLPQGKFAEFMAGEADERRRILTDLLDLSRFLRMGQRARQTAKESKEKAQTIDELVGSQYAHATVEALRSARTAATAAMARQEALATAATGVRDVAEEWRSVAAEVRDIRSCAAEASGLSTAASRHAAALDELARMAGEADRDLTEAEGSSKEARAAAEAASRARGDAEARWGTATDLVRAYAEAKRLADVRAQLRDRSAVLESAEAAIPAASVAVGEAETALADATASAERASADREAAAARLEEVRHADLVSTVVSGLKPGDPCPVCGETLTVLPERAGAKALPGAKKAEQDARSRVEAASAACRKAEVDLERARAALESAERDRVVARHEVDRCGGEAAKLEAALQDMLDEPVEDPAAELARRAALLEGLSSAERDGERSATEAERRAREAAGTRERIAAEAATARAGLDALVVAPLAGRAAVLAPDVTAPARPDLPLADDAPALAAAARELTTALAAYGEALDEAARRRSESERDFLARARAAVDGLIEEAGSLDALVAALDREEREALATATRRQAEAEAIERDLASVAELRGQIGDLRARAAIFRSLAQELQADRLIAFLQAEALRLLAVGGSKRLASLSSGRYELAYDDDEFIVVDRWNGDETRSVRTLSGGETFLASLALALALAEQVSSLAVTAHASLDSLFLDEGFGTLDPETLATVIEAIEQLGGDGRMVGVITHVRDLADQLPARLEVTKSPRGSTIRAG